MIDLILPHTITGVVGVLVTVLGYEWKKKRDKKSKKKQEIEQWCQEALEKITRATVAAHKGTRFNDFNHILIQNKFDNIAEDIMAHSAKAPEGIDQRLLKELKFFSGLCMSLAGMAELRENESGSEYIKSILETSLGKSNTNPIEVMMFIDQYIGDGIDDFTYDGEIIEDEDAAHELATSFENMVFGNQELSSEELPLEHLDTAFDGEFLEAAGKETSILMVERILMEKAEEIIELISDVRTQNSP